MPKRKKRWREQDPSLKPCTHEQIKHPLFEQIRPELLHTDLEFEQIKSIYLLHVYEALSRVHNSIQFNYHGFASFKLLFIISAVL